MRRRFPTITQCEGKAAVTQMTESAAERLTPARAAELTKVLDLKCQWEDMRVGASYSAAQLHTLQKAFETYRVSMLAYTAGDRGEPIPDLSPSGPTRLRTWCRTVRAVLSRAGEADCPTHVVTKAFRVADRIADRVHAARPGREDPTNMGGAIRQLDAVIAWCEGLEAAPPAPEAVAAYEVGKMSAGV